MSRQLADPLHCLVAWPHLTTFILSSSSKLLGNVGRQAGVAEVVAATPAAEAPEEEAVD